MQALYQLSYGPLPAGVSDGAAIVNALALKKARGGRISTTGPPVCRPHKPLGVRVRAVSLSHYSTMRAAFAIFLAFRSART
jgi:hypothetical protein